MIRFAIQCLLLLLVTVLAFWRGGRAEKAVAGSLVASVLLDQGYHFVCGFDASARTNLWHLALDSILFALLIFVALKADRLWTLLPASAQLIAISGYILKALLPDIPPPVFVILNRFPFWMLILITGWGTINYIRRNKRAASNSLQRG